MVLLYRPPNKNTFLETFFNNLKHTDLHQNEMYFLGDFIVSLLLNDKSILKENHFPEKRSSKSALV